MTDKFVSDDMMGATLEELTEAGEQRLREIARLEYEEKAARQQEVDDFGNWVMAEVRKLIPTSLHPYLEFDGIESAVFRSKKGAIKVYLRIPDYAPLKMYFAQYYEGTLDQKKNEGIEIILYRLDFDDCGDEGWLPVETVATVERELLTALNVARVMGSNFEQQLAEAERRNVEERETKKELATTLNQGAQKAPADELVLAIRKVLILEIRDELSSMGVPF